MKIFNYRNVLFLLIWFTAIVSSFAEDTFCENGFTYKIMKRDSSRVSLINYHAVPKVDYSKPLHIPSHVTHDGKDYNVESISRYAFQGVTEVRSIIIDEGVEDINSYAFDCCVNLESIYIPASVWGIGGALFGSCYNLTSVVINPNNERYDSRDNCNAIIDSDMDELRAGCSSTKIPSSVKFIGSHAFYHCYTLEDIIIPEGIETIDEAAFFGCSSLKTISLPESLVELNNTVFNGCNSLTSIYIPKNVSKIDDCNIFAGCNSLKSIVVDDANPYYDSRSNCNGIVRKSDSALIATCRTTTIGNDIKVLEDCCFYGTIIHKLIIPSSINRISNYAFMQSDEIDEIILSPDNKEFISPQGSNAILSKDGKTLILGCRSTIIPEGVEVIGDNAFMGRYSKLFLRIPETVHTIGCGAFKYCNTLFELEIPQSVQLIDSEAFSHCLNLKTVLLKTSVDAISSNTFSHCYNLTNVNLTENDVEILNYAFSGCLNLKQNTP